MNGRRPLRGENTPGTVGKTKKKKEEEEEEKEEEKKTEEEEEEKKKKKKGNNYWEIWDSRKGADKDTCLLGCYSVFKVPYILPFRSNILAPTSCPAAEIT